MRCWRSAHLEVEVDTDKSRRWLGRIRNASINEKSKASVITTDSCRVNCACTPDRKSQGAKATIVVSTAKITGRLTAKAPFTAASSPVNPRCWTWW